MRKRTMAGFLMTVFLFVGLAGTARAGRKISMAVEFVDHAAAAHIALKKGWFAKKGLQISSFDNYITGIALAAAMSHKGIDVAYMCLCPAILAYANGHVPIKIVCGTHKYGYGCLVDPKKIKVPRDLLEPGIRIGCPREGSASDVVMNRFIDHFHLDRGDVLRQVRRMPPPNIMMAMKLGQLDAGFLPEQFPTLGEKLGYRRLADASELWPGMQGSVVVVRRDLIDEDPEEVKAIVEVTKKGIGFIKAHPKEASEIVSAALQAEGSRIFPVKMTSVLKIFQVTPAVIFDSLTRHMSCDVGIDPAGVQAVIDYMAKLGYIRRFKAEKILDLRWLHE